MPALLEGFARQRGSLSLAQVAGDVSDAHESMPARIPPTTSAVADLSGRQLGDLRLLRRLGRGAMAEVYLAEQCRLKRRVAVKILKPALAEDHTYLKRFERRGAGGRVAGPCQHRADPRGGARRRAALHRAGIRGRA